MKFQRDERERLLARQTQRQQEEGRQRADRFRRGLGAVFDFITGKTSKQRKVNEREAWQGVLRDRAQRETLYAQQFEERKDVQRRIDAMHAQHREERMRLARRVIELLQTENEAAQGHSRQHTMEMEP